MQGSVFRARWRGTQVAVKRIHHESRGDSNLAVSREVMVGQVMGHPNLVGSHPKLPAEQNSGSLQSASGLLRVYFRCFTYTSGPFRRAKEQQLPNKQSKKPSTEQ